MRLNGWHFVLAVVVLAAIGELTRGMISKVVWSIASIIVAIHTLQVLQR